MPSSRFGPLVLGAVPGVPSPAGRRPAGGMAAKFMVRPGLAAALASGSVTNARVISVNVGRGKDADWLASWARTAIDKRPAAGQVEVGRLGLGGDEQVDKPAHGGPEQAVYAYAREDLDWWVEQLGREMTNGMFGENITTAGVDVTGALIGEIWQLGTATVQVTGPRIPAWCSRAGSMSGTGSSGSPTHGGPARTCACCARAWWAPGIRSRWLSRPCERVTIAESMTAYYGDAELMSRLLRVEGRGLAWDESRPACCSGPPRRS